MSSYPTPPPDLLDERQLSAEWQIPQRTLTMWRYRKIGPPYVKLGAQTVRYRRADVDAWRDSRIVQTAGGSDVRG